MLKKASSLVDVNCNKRKRLGGGTPNQIYINVQPPSTYQTFERYPVKIGKSSTNGRVRMEREAHAALFRPLCDIYVLVGPQFRALTERVLEVDYRGIQGDEFLFERFIHHKWDSYNNRHLVKHYEEYTHEEMFHMDHKDIQQLLSDIQHDQKRYDYTLCTVQSHETKWAADHPKWQMVFTS
jgi:hypothetical protein